MKQRVLHKMYQIFEQWSNRQPLLSLACKKGCAVCCTQNVTVTAIEAEDILRYIQSNDKCDWFAARLSATRGQSGTHYKAATVTTNDFARACLESRDIDPELQSSTAVCPFLEQNLCSIYPARPFSCRLFLSQKTCLAGQAAVVPNYYLEASTAVSQLIEHLGQKEYWGNMLDVLPALLDISEFRDIAEKCSQTIIIQSRMRTLSAQPLPGFLLSEEGEPMVRPLLEEIFAAEIDGKSIEDILNGT
jgi:Fe-S-cluster containining protein